MTTTTFESAKSLFNDLKIYHRSYLKSENEVNSNTDKSTIEGITLYEVVKLIENKLIFCSDRYGGSELIITGKINKAEKVSNPDSFMSEYSIHIENRKEPLILLACKKEK